MLLGRFAITTEVSELTEVGLGWGTTSPLESLEKYSKFVGKNNIITKIRRKMR